MNRKLSALSVALFLIIIFQDLAIPRQICDMTNLNASLTLVKTASSAASTLSSTMSSSLILVSQYVALWPFSIDCSPGCQVQQYAIGLKFARSCCRLGHCPAPVAIAKEAGLLRVNAACAVYLCELVFALATVVHILPTLLQHLHNNPYT
jgi:hypothetical protein